MPRQVTRTFAAGDPQYARLVSPCARWLEFVITFALPQPHGGCMTLFPNPTGFVDLLRPEEAAKEEGRVNSIFVLNALLESAIWSRCWPTRSRRAHLACLA